MSYDLGLGDPAGMRVWRCCFSIFDPLHALSLFLHPPFSICNVTAIYLLQIYSYLSVEMRAILTSREPGPRAPMIWRYNLHSHSVDSDFMAL